MEADHSRIARAALGFDERDLADEAGIPLEAVLAIERGDGVDAELLEKLTDALGRAGVSFHIDAKGQHRMRVRTLDGIIETPVAFAKK